MSFFDQIATADVYSNLPFIEPGEYLFNVDKVVHITSKRGKGEFVIAEFTIEEAVSNAPALQVGGRCSIRCKLSDVMGPKNAAEFLTAAVSSLNGKATALAKGDESRLIGEGSALVGQKVRCAAFLRPKATKPGEEYTHVNWQPVY